MKKAIIFSLLAVCRFPLFTQELTSSPELIGATLQKKFYTVEETDFNIALMEAHSTERLSLSRGVPDCLIEVPEKMQELLHKNPSLVKNCCLAYYVDSPRLFYFLLDHGADIQSLDQNGNNALHRFSFSCIQRLENAYVHGMMQRLLNVGININQRNHQHQTPLMRILSQMEYSNSGCVLTITNYLLAKNVIEQKTSYFSLLPPDLRAYIKSKHTILNLKDHYHEYVQILDQKKYELLLKNTPLNAVFFIHSLLEKAWHNQI